MIGTYQKGKNPPVSGEEGLKCFEEVCSIYEAGDKNRVVRIMRGPNE